MPSFPQKPHQDSWHLRDPMWKGVPALSHSWNTANVPTPHLDEPCCQCHHPHYLEVSVSIISIFFKVSFLPNQRLVNCMISDSRSLIGTWLIQTERMSPLFPLYQRDTTIYKFERPGQLYLPRR